MQENNSPPGIWFFIKLAVSSFIFIHIFGLFGVFIAFAYPLWWFFLPYKTLCFFCLHKRVTNPQGTCPVCKRPVTTIYNPPLSSVFTNMAVIVFLSLASMTVIVLEISFFSQGGFNPASLIYGRRAFFVIPEKNTFSIDKKFYFDVNTSTTSMPINVVQADIKFDKDLLKVDHIETSGSFATIFTQKDFSNNEGWIRIIGGLPNPGFLGEYKTFARIYFTPKKVGIGKIEFLKTSRLLANDGRGTNILAQFPTSSIYVTEDEKSPGASNAGNPLQVIIDRIKTSLKASP